MSAYITVGGDPHVTSDNTTTSELRMRDDRLGQISNNVPRKIPVGIFEEKGANHFF